MRLLSIDWDFFFPTKEEDDTEWQLYDWGHSENWSSGLQDVAWTHRAAGFLGNGFPLPGTSGEEKDFWKRFRFSKNARLFIAESHMHCASEEVRIGVTEVVNYDAHHDCGYVDHPLVRIIEERTANCEDWMLVYSAYNGADARVIYPSWRTQGIMAADKLLISGISRAIDDGRYCIDQVFDRVFIARSGAWTPPWIDKNFAEFVESCPIEYSTVIGELEMIRYFDTQEAEKIVTEWKEFNSYREKMEKQCPR